MRFMLRIPDRVPGHVGEPPNIRRAVEKEAKKYNCSMNFVRNVAIAWALGIELEEDYKKPVVPVNYNKKDEPNKIVKMKMRKKA